MIKRDLTNMTFNISPPHIMTKTTKVFNKDMKQLMTCNAMDTPHTEITDISKRGTLPKNFVKTSPNMFHCLDRY